MPVDLAPPTTGPAPTDLPRRALVTLACLAILVGATRVPLPGQPRLPAEISPSDAGISLGMFGVMPLISGALVAAALAWLFGLRAWRRAGPPGESPLERRLPAFALGIGAVQTFTIWATLRSPSFQELPDPGDPTLAAVSALGFAALAMLLVAWNDRAGLGNLVVLSSVGVSGAAMLRGAVQSQLLEPRPPPIAAICVVGLYLAGLAQLLRHPSAPGRPGLGAAYIGLKLAVALGMILAISEGWRDLLLTLGVSGDGALRLVLSVVAAATGALVLTVASVRPAALAQVWRQESDGGLARLTTLRATGVAAGLALAVWAWGAWDQAIQGLDLVALVAMLGVGQIGRAHV